VLLHLAPLLLLKGADGSDQLLYGQAAAAAAGGGLMESSYRNLQEARVTLQAVYALMTAGEDLNSTPMFVHLGAYWLLLWPCSAINICGSTGWFIQSQRVYLHKCGLSGTQWWCVVCLCLQVTHKLRQY
jgi:hypothetical protein